jgi:hypothetical protein
MSERALAKRCLLADVEWLEIWGADEMGTRDKAVLDAERPAIVARARAGEPDAIWLAAVGGYAEGIPDDDSPVALVAQGLFARGSAAHGAKMLAIAEGSAPRETRLAAMLSWVVGQPSQEVPTTIRAFLDSVPRDLQLENFPFREGRAGEYTHALLSRLWRYPGESVEDPEHWLWDPSALDAPVNEPEGESESETESVLEEEDTNPYLLERPRASGDLAFELAGLDTVDWKSLEDAYGTATGVPLFLQALASTSEKQREWALQSLYAGINHQGSTFSASVAAVPFLMTLATTPAVPERVKIVRLLLGLATGEPPWALLKPIDTLCLEPISAQHETLIPLLEDPDLAIRAAVIHLFGHLPPAAKALEAALAREEDAYLRSSIVMALAHGARIRVPCDDNPLGRAVAALIPFYTQSALSTDEREAILAIADSWRVFHPRYAWGAGDISGHARLIHDATMPVDEALDGLEAGRRELASYAHGLLFPRSEWRFDDLILPEELNPDQMRYLRWATTTDNSFYYPHWRDSGLPNTKRWIERFVGAAPAGPLDQRVNGLPLWKILHETTAELRPSDAWFSAVASLSDDELLAVFDDAEKDFQFRTIRTDIDSLNPDQVARARAYRIRHHRTLLEPLAARPGTVRAIRARAEALLESKERSNSTYKERTLYFALLGLAKAANDPRLVDLARPGDWSPAMTFAEELRWGLAELPLEVRWRWFEGQRLVSLTRNEDARGVRHTIRIHGGWDFLDLIPTPEGNAMLNDAVAIIAEHRRGKTNTEHELGFSKAPINTWAKDETLPEDVIRRIEAAWQIQVPR